MEGIGALEPCLFVFNFLAMKCEILLHHAFLPSCTASTKVPVQSCTRCITLGKLQNLANNHETGYLLHILLIYYGKIKCLLTILMKIKLLAQVTK